MLNWSTQLIGWERQFGREIVNELHSTDWYGAVHSTVVSQWYGTVIYHSTMVIPLVWHRIRWSPIHLISTSPVQKRVNSSAVNQEDFLLFPVIHVSSNLGVFWVKISKVRALNSCPVFLVSICPVSSAVSSVQCPVSLWGDLLFGTLTNQQMDSLMAANFLNHLFARLLNGSLLLVVS